ncbi:MAG: hypothetical protein MMC23_009923 [Stictis urceolatum]|nr:hypothetical protein [Stictis urceolata]
MEPTITLICGDDLETNVFASSYAGDLSILFRFSFDASQRRRINSRIVACFHDLEVDDAESSFADRAAMRLAIQSSISQAWQECASHPSVRLPDVVVQIQENEHGEVSWQIIHESSYREYVGGLMTTEHVRSTLIPESRRSQLELMPLGSSQLSDVLGGRGDTTLTQTSNGSDTRRTFVYKGLSFRPFLELGSGFHDEKETLYHEPGVVYSLPSHPNIISPLCFLITTKLLSSGTTLSSTDTNYICGSLYPYLEQQSFQEVIEKSNQSGKVLSQTLKAKWAHQISSALAATHRSNQYHMDPKPNNILLDNDDNAILID